MDERDNIARMQEVLTLCGCYDCGRRLVENGKLRHGIFMFLQDKDGDDPFLYPYCFSCLTSEEHNNET